MHITDTALSLGFTEAVEFSPALLVPHERIRALCNETTCPTYGHCWLCPPHCDSLEAMRGRLAAYRRALLLTSRSELQNPDDIAETLRRAALHSERVLRLAKELPGSLALTVGGCRLCERCTCPGAPCRRPELRVGAVSAHGIDAGEVCQALSIPFAFERGRLVFIGFVLW